MIKCSFTTTVNFISKYNGNKAGWCQTHIEFSSRLGWNFFTRIRHWDREMKNFLPAVTKFRIRTVEYYGEKQEKNWNFIDKEYEYYPVFEDKARNVNGPDVRLIQSIYRFPFITITNAYHTKLDEQRHKEFTDELNRDQSEHIVDRVG